MNDEYSYLGNYFLLYSTDVTVIILMSLVYITTKLHSSEIIVSLRDIQLKFYRSKCMSVRYYQAK